MRRYLIIICSLFLLICCDKDKINKTKEENKILDLAYNSNFLYPEGFFYETISEGSVYYENTVSIKPISERESKWIELSTNDKSEALLWSNYSNNYSSVNRDIISERETEKYFEFKRKNVDNSSDILLSRIHKTSYFQPKLDKFRVLDTIGIYNDELDEYRVKELIEYLWSCGSLGLDHSKVIESQIQEYSDYFEQYIQSIKIVYGDWNINDYIYVYDNYFRINKTDRTLTFVTNEIKTIVGKEN